MLITIYFYIQHLNTVDKSSEKIQIVNKIYAYDAKKKSFFFLKNKKKKKNKKNAGYEKYEEILSRIIRDVRGEKKTKKNYEKNIFIHTFLGFHVY